MTDKLKSYRGAEASPEDKENADIAAQEEEAIAEELAADPDVVVPTGDEEAPIAQPVHSDSLRALFDKGKKNRDKLINRDSDDHPDVAIMQMLAAEAAGEDPDALLDTNRGDRFDAEGAEPIPDDPEAPETSADPPDPEAEAGTGVEDDPETIGSDVGEEEDVSFSQPEPDARVSVKLLDKHYDVPQQDIDDAGGIEAYQKNRVANMRLHRASVLEKQAREAERRATASTPPEQPDADPPEGGQGEADITDLREQVYRTVIDGTEEELDALLRKNRQPAKVAPSEPESTVTADPAEAEPLGPAERDLQHQYAQDLADTNAMMLEDFPDIMDGSLETATPVQRRRFLDAQSKFESLVRDPMNAGRTQVDMAREAANAALRVTYKEEDTTPVPAIEKERRTRVERKRRLPQVSRADAPAPDTTRKPKKTIPTRKDHLARLRAHSGHPD